MMTVRLQKLISLIPQCNVLADVGCDHGYVGIEALSRGIAKNVVFVDISQPSLNKARQNCPKQYLANAQFVCADGLGDIVADCAIIAGMGGLEIISILDNAKHLPEQLVLQPMRNQRDVRSKLTEKYEIVLDEKFFDAKYYDVIVAKRSNKPTKLRDLELEFGKTNFLEPSDDFVTYLLNEQAKLTKILNNCDDENVKSRLTLIERALSDVLKQ